MTTPTVALCVPTYRRPKTLRNLLESLRHLEKENFGMHLIVADNDPEESARIAVEEFRESVGFPVSYVSEPARGLSTVRNRLVKEANNIDAAFIAFVDDDETVDPMWLTTLVAQILESNADGVGGRQVFEFAENTPEYIRTCFSNPPRFSGQPLKAISTANGIYRLEALNKIIGPFDLRLNLTGGEDSMLSARLRNAGYHLVGSHDAVTYEFVPPSRCTPAWIIKRAYRVGTTRGRIARWVDPSPKSIVTSGIVSGGLIVVSIVQLLYFLIVDRTQWLNRTRKIANGAGGLVALVSTKAVPSEYTEIHGG